MKTQNPLSCCFILMLKKDKDKEIIDKHSWNDKEEKGSLLTFYFFKRYL